MIDKESKFDIQNLINIEQKYLDNLLDKKDFEKFKHLNLELKDTWIKKQIFRTETEMRISVLSDLKHPTNASKYWQCVREQSAFFENLMTLSFDYRKNIVEIEKLKIKLKKEKNSLEKKLLQIEIEEKLYSKANMELVAKDRMREISSWSELKKEFDDGSFDTQDPNQHQGDSYEKRLESKFKTITQGTSQPEVFNIVTQLETLSRLKKEGVSMTKITDKNKKELLKK